MEERDFPKGERTTMERGAPNTARRSPPQHPGSVRVRRAVNGDDDRPGPVTDDEPGGADEDGES